MLNRQVKLPQLTSGERLRMVLLARCTKFWKQAIHIVQPDTLLRWHRNLFRIYWRWKSNPKKKKPRISPETTHIIQQIANENRVWGAERIRGELLKLGIRVSKRTIQRYLPKERKTAKQTWAAFLKNHAGDIWACDFTVVYDLLFRPIFIFVILELKTRLIIYSAVTQSQPMNGQLSSYVKLHRGFITQNSSFGTMIENMVPYFHPWQSVQVS